MRDGRVALVTGGARGLGFAIGRRLAEDGLTVVLADLAVSSVTESAQEIDGRAHVLDVTDDASVEKTITWIEDELGRLDVLVNNAGIISRTASHDVDSAVWTREIDVHLGGTMRCSRQAHRLLSSSDSASVINLASVGSTLGLPMRLAYTAAKSGITGMTRTLAAEWGPDGIRVNAIAPGYMDTAMTRSGIETGVLDGDRLLQRTPLRRLGRPDEIASSASFLASSDASFVTGTVLCVDGGITVDGTFHNEQ
ncbi:SDR family NAD(P)-dependent oxidoreductase [Gordonia humi]|uniref:NAD(P)-dependent dehydrogenase (Short-subunit alcohol dehydrogenase family) n=1 Tax=Gordonia humi TaxID=686429 RepID=A0A840EW47_9ACTN|nr:SDR family NAD(P)-dependent oxidoreductase [Gordonia humi]MBB4134056.1 NAD(P)-dependent dehydrogenase (short-subunit alcohol dehydrogenase family) [Gordonia humi]